MARFPSDAMLALAARLPDGRVRRWAARKAAARSLHGVALRAAADDPYVLARLGLYPLALNAPGEDDLARYGRDLARAALGRPFELDRWAIERWYDERHLLIRAMAPYDPSRAAIELISRHLDCERAACRLAAGELDDAARLVKHCGGREGEAIRAAIACREGDARAAAGAINAMFAVDGIARVIPFGAAGCALENYASPALGAEHGPSVSVIVPIHDDAPTIATALGCLISQSWRNLEIIVVDDRSSDGGAAIVRDWAARDERVTIIANARTPGVYGARNTGIQAARGEHIAFLDADDWSPGERIARQVAALERAAVSIGNHIRVDQTGAPLAPRVFPLVRPVPITMLMRRETMIAAGLFEEVATGADSEMLGRLEMLHGRSAIKRDPAVLLVARWREGSLSQAGEGGLFGEARFAYRADWMFRQAGLEPPLASGENDGQDGVEDGEDSGH